MNREIKFRVWGDFGNSGGEFTYIYHCGHHNPSLNDIFNQKEFIFQQFTGLKDSNNKDIYEGDIIKTQIYDGWDAVPYGYCNYEVKWSLVELAWRGYTNEMNELHSGVIFKDVLIEVVGNIFEDFELLDNGKKFIKDVHKKIGWES
jgi:uncharacterized phage protein (TIGR01671 family)